MRLRIIVGLGNPGRKYQNHRHNIGFRVVDALAERNGIRFNRERFRALLGKGEIAAVPVLLAKPQTFMNRSGESVARILAGNSASVDSLIVVHDDLDLDRGRIRIKEGGGHGGHNGVRSVIRECGEAGVIRIRVGIGRPENGDDPAEYGLRPDPDGKEMGKWVQQAVGMIEELLEHGPAATMNRYHSKEGL